MGLAPIFSIILPIFSAVSTIIGSSRQASAQRDTGEAQRQAYEYNAAVSRNNAVAAQNAAAADKTQQDRLNQARLGSLRAGILKQGVALEGTPLLLIGEEAEQGALESAKITHRGEVAATNYRNQSQQDVYAGYQAQKAADTRAGNTLLTGNLQAAGTLSSQLLRTTTSYR